MKNNAAPPVDMGLMERQIRSRGFSCVAGIDEAGRGPLAGPVVAAAVILPAEAFLPQVQDSKLLRPAQREVCFQAIMACARAVSVGLMDAEEIDCINILRATHQAMLKAVQGLKIAPEYLLIDGPIRLPLNVPQEGIIRGDRCCLSIAAASIIAKVHRDRLMCQYHLSYPAYRFDLHKGYPTAAHLQALRSHGPCPLHRKSFRGVLEPQ